MNTLPRRWEHPLAFLLMAFCALFIFKDYLFADALYLFKDIGSDTITTFYPQMYHVAAYLEKEGLPTWSFAQGLGQNIFPFSLSDPFTNLLYFADKDNLAYYIAHIEALKLALAALLFYGYLRTLSCTWETALIGGLCYGFSGFMVLGSGWYIFSTEGVYLAALLLAFERSLLRQDDRFLPLSIGFIAATQPFNLLPMGLFMILYGILRYADVQARFQTKDFLIWGAKLLLCAGIGLMLSSFFLVNELIMMAQSPRVGGESSQFKQLLSQSPFQFSDTWTLKTIAARFFGNDLLGQGSNFTGSNNYLEAPTLYCGIGILILLPQFFLQANRKQRLLYGALLGFFVLALFLPFFRRLIWGFTGDYYRIFNLFVAISFIFLSVQALQKIWNEQKLNLPVLLATSFVWLLILMYPAKGNLKLPNGGAVAMKVDEMVRSLSVFFLLAHTGLIVFVKYSQGGVRQLLQYLSLALFVAELVAFGIFTLKKRPVITKKEYAQKIGYNDYSKDAVAHLQSIDPNFYRLSKNYPSGVAIHTSMNDAKVQGYYASASYSSFNQKYYIEFLTAMGLVNPKDETQTRWSPGVEPRPLLQILTSTKYRLIKGAGDEAAGPAYQRLHQVGDVVIYKNPNFLPLGFTYSQRVDPKLLASLEPIQRDIALLRAVALEQSELPQLPKDSILPAANYTLDVLQADVNRLKADTLAISQFKNAHIKGKIKLTQPKFLFFSIPYDQGWALRVNQADKPIERANFGFWGVSLPAGEYEIELVYTPPYFYESLYGSLLGLGLLLAWIFWQGRKRREA
jgi:uncharacterized membrane protein YfhO